jgi:hypothetical protein
VTIAESKWHENKEKQDAMVNEFIAGHDSVEVLKARLYGLGLRGDYLESELAQAVARKATRNKNWNCDNDKCRDPKSEVRTYPTGGGGNMILCRDCWAHENNYRMSRGGEFKGFPLVRWGATEVYKKAGE